MVTVISKKVMVAAAEEMKCLKTNSEKIVNKTEKG